jgi:Protein of unknown function (DUF4012)
MMRRRIIFTFIATLLAFPFIGIAFNSVQLWSTYRSIPKSPIPDKQAIAIGNSLHRDTEDLLRYLSFPGIRQLSELAGLDIFRIKPELLFITKHFPELAGYDRPKKYMISFQNSAEARGTGGILGAYAIVEINRGSLSVIKASSNIGLRHIPNLPIKHSDEYFELYGNNPGIWQNANLSPHFPYGAMNYLELWRLQTGEVLDGFIATDPIALSYFLRSTGVVTLPDGFQITSENVVEETLKTAYKRYETDNLARKEFLVTIMKSTFDQLLAGNFNPRALPTALSQSIEENRLQIFIAEQITQEENEKTRLAGSLNEAADNEYRVIIQNTDASKLDYYLDREIDIESLNCSPEPKTQVTVYLKNRVLNAQDLPSYVLTRADKGKPKELVTGQHRFKVFIYGPYKSELIGGSLGSGVKGKARTATERGRPIFIEDIDLVPDASEIIVAQFSGGEGSLKLIKQPLVRPELVKIIDKC